METFCVHSLIDTTSEESVEFDPVDYGDIREKWERVCCGFLCTRVRLLWVG